MDIVLQHCQENTNDLFNVCEIVEVTVYCGDGFLKAQELPVCSRGHNAVEDFDGMLLCRVEYLRGDKFGVSSKTRPILRSSNSALSRLL